MRVPMITFTDLSNSPPSCRHVKTIGTFLNPSLRLFLRSLVVKIYVDISFPRSRSASRLVICDHYVVRQRQGMLVMRITSLLTTAF